MNRLFAAKVLAIALVCFILPDLKHGLFPGADHHLQAKQLRKRLFTSRRPASPHPSIVRAEAYAGEPFGVGKITFRVGEAGKIIQNTGAIRVSESKRRILYPAFSDGLLSRVLDDRPLVGGLQTVWFLFRGDAPLQVKLTTAENANFDIDVTRRRPGLARMAYQQWWRQFNAQARQGIKAGDYPPLVETYLTTMLGRRLNLEPPLLDRRTAGGQDELKQTFSLLFDVESIRAESIRQLMSQPPVNNQAMLPLPPAFQWRNPYSSIPANQFADVAVEAIARFVPQECFYLRFGNWQNQLWLKKLMLEYGGDLSTMIQMRGHRITDTNKMLDQLVLESSSLDDWFGGNLVEDVAVIGTDLYVEDGPSNAVMLLAKNGSLERQITNRRKKVARDRADEGITLQEIDIDGHAVTLLSTPDNLIRSYYAVHDRCHITSSSRRIIERFFQAAAGNGNLADNIEFRQARSILPLEQDHTVFVYLSRNFFENLLNPHYQIELARRNRSLANIQLLQLAQMAAESEGYAPDNLQTMMQHGLLPENYNQLPDGSFTQWQDDQWHDSVRGRRGYFVPIADMAVNEITASESRWLNQRLNFYSNQVSEIDPILVGIKRFDLGNKTERVVFDAHVAPFGKEKYGWLGKMLGPPLEFQVSTQADDLISIQASLAGRGLLGRDVPPHQVFAAVQGDIPPKTDLRPANFLELFQLLKTTPGYVGAWPKPGYLDILPALGGQPDPEGYTYSRLLDLWRLQHGEFSLVSFDRNRLENVRDQLQIIEAERPAQVRLRVGDIVNSNLQGWANVMFYKRQWDTSVANVQLLNLMIQQFRLAPETALPMAEQLLGVKLVCPLGGEYMLAATASGQTTWQSDRWPSFDDPQMPAEYAAPPMKWFRGMSLDVYQLQTQFVVHGSLDIARASSTADPKTISVLPSFNLFKGFSKVEELPAAKEQLDNSSGELTPPKEKK